MKYLLLLILTIATPTHATTCTFTWDPSVSGNVAVYNLYRYTELIQSGIDGLEFKTLCISGKYTVSAVSYSGTESVRSKTVTVKKRAVYVKGQRPKKVNNLKIEVCK